MVLYSTLKLRDIRIQFALSLASDSRTMGKKHWWLLIGFQSILRQVSPLAQKSWEATLHSIGPYM